MAYKTSKNISIAKMAQDHGIDRRGIYIDSEKSIGFDPLHLANLMAQDSATLPNTATPAELTTYFDPKVIEVAFSPCKAEELGNVKMVGDWVTTNYKFQIIEHTGMVRPYSDHSEDPTIELNDNFENREFYGMEQVITYGDKEVAVKARTFVDWVSQKRTAIAESFKIELNKIFFGGVNGKNTYGILTDPNRVPSVTAPNGAAGTSTWATKTGMEIVADIQTMVNNLINQSGEIVDGTEEMILALPSAVLNTLRGKFADNAVTFQTTYEWLQIQFPRIELIGIPQYATTGGNVADLMLRTYAGERPIELIISERYRSHGVEKRISWQQEKISASTAGAVVTRPWMISSMIGI